MIYALSAHILIMSQNIDKLDWIIKARSGTEWIAVWDLKEPCLTAEPNDLFHYKETEFPVAPHKWRQSDSSLSVCLSVCLSMSVYLPDSICLCVCLPASDSLSTCLTLSVCVSVCLCLLNVRSVDWCLERGKERGRKRETEREKRKRKASLYFIKPKGMVSVC